MRDLSVPAPGLDGGEERFPVCGLGTVSATGCFADSGVKVLVCGSRRFADPLRASLTIAARIRQLPAGTTVLHGAAVGADAMAVGAAWMHELIIEAFPADWKRNGKRAGIIRNLTMLDEQPDLVLAFWNGVSLGTMHTTAEARKRGIPVEIVRLQ